MNAFSLEDKPRASPPTSSATTDATSLGASFWTLNPTTQPQSWHTSVTFFFSNRAARATSLAALSKSGRFSGSDPPGYHGKGTHTHLCPCFERRSMSGVHMSTVSGQPCTNTSVRPSGEGHAGSTTVERASARNDAGARIELRVAMADEEDIWRVRAPRGSLDAAANGV